MDYDLHISVYNNDINRFRQVISEELEKNCDYLSDFPFDVMGAIINMNIIDMMKILLVEYNFDIKWKNNKILSLCASKNNIEMIKLLVELGANINVIVKDVYGIMDCSLITISCKCNNLTMTKFLLDNGIDVNADNGRPLYYSSTYGYYDTVKLLIEYGANINNDKAIMAAILFGQYDIVKLLLDNGANLSAATDFGSKNRTTRNNNFNKLFDLLSDNGLPYHTIISLFMCTDDDRNNYLK